MEITLKDLWKVLKKSIIFVILGAIIFGAAFYVYTDKTEAKVYRSSAKYYLAPLIPPSTSADMNNNLVVGSKYIPTLGDYLMTEDTMELVLKVAGEWAATPQDNADPEEWRKEWSLEDTYNAKSLVGKFSFVSPGEDETNLTFSVRCTTNSAKDCRILLHAFGRIVNERCMATVLKNAYAVETIREAGNGAKIAPNPMNKAMLGFAIGAVLPYAIFFVLNLIDTRIKTEEDVKNRFEYPILGQIPRL